MPTRANTATVQVRGLLAALPSRPGSRSRLPSPGPAGCSRNGIRRFAASEPAPATQLDRTPWMTGDRDRALLQNQIQSDNLFVVKTLSVTDVARNFSAVLDALERDQEEILLVRNQRHVARLIPEAPHQDALTVFGDLYRTLDDKTAEALSAAITAQRKRRRGRVAELRDPWAG